jgi:hypothetical protein
MREWRWDSSSFTVTNSALGMPYANAIEAAVRFGAVMDLHLLSGGGAQVTGMSFLITSAGGRVPLFTMCGCDFLSTSVVDSIRFTNIQLHELRGDYYVFKLK